MNPGITSAHAQFRADVRLRLAESELQGHIAALRASGEPEPDARPLYRELGRRGLLAVSWPEEYGGAGRSLTEGAILAEELVRAGVPDTLHVNSIQIVGSFLLLAGTAGQQARYLPRLAAGTAFASVLYTEPGAGSDLAALSTVATRDGDHYLLDGVKTFSLKSDVADFALCIARTSQEESRYQGITLFLVDLDAAGVHESPIPSLADEAFHQVALHGVKVPADAVVGEVGGAWPLLDKALTMERTGLDYVLKAEKWYRTTVAGLAARPGSAAGQAGRFGAALTAGHLLAWDVIGQLEAGTIDAASAAVAKYYTAELASQVAGWAARAHGPGYGGQNLSPEQARELDAAFREGPALTLSAGTSEMMLQIVANSVLDAAGQPADAGDAAERSLQAAIRRALADGHGPGDRGADGALVAPAGRSPHSPAWQALTELGVPAFEAPAEAGGLDLGLGTGALVAQEIGRAGLSTPHADVAMAVDAATAGSHPWPDDLVSRLMTGDLTVTAAFCGSTPVRAARRHQPGHRQPGGPHPGQGQQAARWLLEPGAVLGPRSADMLCLPADLDGSLAIVLADTKLLTAEPAQVASGWLRFPLAGGWLEEAHIACRGAAAHQVLAAARLRQAAYLAGLGWGAFGEAAQQAGQRKQFGRRLRDFQSLAFRLADAYCRLKAAQLLIRQAAWLADTGQPAGDAAMSALAVTAELALDVTTTAIHVCGARGLAAGSRTAAYYRLAQHQATRFGTPDEFFGILGMRCLPPADTRDVVVPG